MGTGNVSANIFGGLIERLADLWDSEGINQIWPTFFNGCDITRPTDEWLLQAGEWQEVKLRPGEGEGPYDTVPHVIGHLVKK